MQPLFYTSKFEKMRGFYASTGTAIHNNWKVWVLGIYSASLFLYSGVHGPHIQCLDQVNKHVKIVCRASFLLISDNLVGRSTKLALWTELSRSISGCKIVITVSTLESPTVSCDSNCAWHFPRKLFVGITLQLKLLDFLTYVLFEVHHFSIQ